MSLSVVRVSNSISVKYACRAFVLSLPVAPSPLTSISPRHVWDILVWLITVTIAAEIRALVKGRRSRNRSLTVACEDWCFSGSVRGEYGCQWLCNERWRSHYWGLPTLLDDIAVLYQYWEFSTTRTWVWDWNIRWMVTVVSVLVLC